MNIALDYDGTFTEDPGLWLKFIESAQAHGHTVMLVTMRYPVEQVTSQLKCPVHYTSRQAKRRYMQNMGIEIQVWIDDIPEFILHSTQEALWPEDLAAEYQCQTDGCDLPKKHKADAHCIVCQRNGGAVIERAS